MTIFETCSDVGDSWFVSYNSFFVTELTVFSALMITIEFLNWNWFDQLEFLPSEACVIPFFELILNNKR